MTMTFPTSLSPSRTNDFLTCPLLYRFRTIDNLPETPTPAAVRGTLVHRALEDLFGRQPQQRTVQEAYSLLEAAFAELERTQPEHAKILAADAVDPAAILQPAIPLLETYFQLEDPQRLEPHQREMGVSASLGDDFVIRGFVDRVDRAPSGAVRIVDYKTGRAPAANFESKAMFQMRFYALIWWRMTNEIPAMLQLIYLGSGDILRYEPDEADLHGTERKILAIREAIRQAGARGDFRATPSRLCDWCSFSEWCPAFGGAAPELPDRATWSSGRPITIGDAG
jgi:putative RecB family exonuclease